MRKLLLGVIALVAGSTVANAQQPKPEPAKIQTVINAEKAFEKTVARKGIKEGFLSVADVEGIVFKPDAVKITDFYGNIAKQPGSLTWTPDFARTSANGDLAFTAGPYIYQNGKGEDKIYGEYVSVWRTDVDNKLRLLIDLGIQHPEPEKPTMTDIREPDAEKVVAPSNDPFKGKQIIQNTDIVFNESLKKTTLGSYKEFLSPEGRLYFPGFEPMTGKEQIMRFVENQAIFVTAHTVNAGRAVSGDLAYSYGTARIKKGNIVSNFNYVRIWEQDKEFKWNILLEIYSAVEN